MSGLGTVFRRIIALLLLIVALSPLLFLVSMGRAAYLSASDDIASRVEIYDRLRAIAQFHNKIPAAVAADNGPQVLLGEGTPAVLSAGLQAKLRAMATGVGVDIQQASELQLKPEGKFTQIGVHIELTGQQKAIHQFLEKIAANVPWYFTDNFHINSGYVAETDTPDEPALTAALDVWGLGPEVAKATP